MNNAIHIAVAHFNLILSRSLSRDVTASETWKISRGGCLQPSRGSALPEETVRGPASRATAPALIDLSRLSNNFSGGVYDDGKSFALPGII